MVIRTSSRRFPSTNYKISNHIIAYLMRGQLLKENFFITILLFMGKALLNSTLGLLNMIAGQ